MYWGLFVQRGFKDSKYYEDCISQKHITYLGDMLLYKLISTFATQKFCIFTRHLPLEYRTQSQRAKYFTMY